MRSNIQNLIKNKKKILKKYRKGQTMNNLRYQYRCGSNTIKQFLQKNDIIIRNFSQARKEFSINEDYFKKINSHEKAYWLGFLYADGNVCNGKVQIGLASRDKIIIKNFQKAINSNHKVYDDRGYPKLIISNLKMYNDLIKLGCVPNKSLKLKFPNKKKCPKKYINSFILGFFDGDGSISLTKGNRCRTKSRWAIFFVSTREFLSSLKNILLPIAKSKITLFKEKRTKNNTWYLSLGGGSVQESSRKRPRRIYNFLYKNIKNPLHRKKEKFLKITSKV